MAAAASDQFCVQCSCQAPEAVPLQDEATASHLYRIAQEAVRNAVRHGGATRIWVSLAKEGARIRLAIVDNGGGLPPPALRGKGMGLRIMGHRAEMIGAEFSADALKGGGTRIQCSLPIGQKQSAPPLAVA
jgi:signal transduction histidine kinase